MSKKLIERWERYKEKQIVNPTKYRFLAAKTYADEMVYHIEQLLVRVKYLNKKLLSNTLRELADMAWISVEDRLPEETGVVIVYHPGWGIRMVLHNKHESEILIGLNFDSATHWMPLPKSPKDK